MAVKTVDVSYKVGMSGPIVYSVELSNPVTGLQWQGTVGASGQVAEWSQMLERIKLWVEKAAPAEEDVGMVHETRWALLGLGSRD